MLANDSARIYNTVDTNPGAVSDNRAKFPEACINPFISGSNAHRFVVETEIGKHSTTAHITVIADYRISNIVDVGHMNIIHDNTVF